MMKMNSIVTSTLLTAISLLSAAAYAQPPQALMRRPISQWGWTKKWTAPEDSLRRIRQEIDRALPKGTSPAKVWRLYQERRTAAEKDSANSEKAFAWHHACYRASTVDSAFDQGEATRARVALLMGRYPVDNAEWARLRFVIESRPIARPQLKAVGRRLVNKYPTDYEVKFHLVRTLSPGASAAEKQEAVSYAQDLIRMEPKRANFHALLAGVYFKSWLFGQSASDVEKATQAYQQFLKLAPSNDPFRSEAQATINYMRTSKLKEKGRK